MLRIVINHILSKTNARDLIGFKECKNEHIIFIYKSIFFELYSNQTKADNNNNNNDDSMDDSNVYNDKNNNNDNNEINDNNNNKDNDGGDDTSCC